MKIFIRFMPVIAFLLMLVGNLDHSLWTPDEPRVAEIAREMAVSGDYLIPHLSGKPFLEKPPLYYAVAGLCYRFWGTSCEGVGRIASVIFGLSTLLVVFWGARKVYNEQIAALSVLILATSYKFYETFHKIEVDNALVLFITIALFSFILAYQKKITSGYYLFWISLACAFMSKGLIGLAIPITVVVLFAVWQRDFSLLKNMRPVWGILLIIAVMASWGLILYMKGGSDFLKTFYVYNQFGRFLGGGEYKGGHINPFYYYLPTVLADALPWSLLFVAALLTTRGLDSTARFFYAWAGLYC
jgi:4-amino-4-deoxy-L-arabinose transferase-like glycosyltransferase